LDPARALPTSVEHRVNCVDTAAAGGKALLIVALEG
jgi:hypothetical protein